MLVESFIASERGEGIFWIISNWDRRIKIKATFVFTEFEYRTRDLGLITGTVMVVKTSSVCSCKNLSNIRIVVLKLKIGKLFSLIKWRTSCRVLEVDNCHPFCDLEVLKRRNKKKVWSLCCCRSGLIK